MSKFSRLTGQRVIAALKRAGFVVLRVKGSHHFLSHSDGRHTVYLFIAAKPSGPD